MDLGRWLSVIPKGWLAVIAIGGGIALIILADPPHSLCESQIDVFQQEQMRFLFLDPQRKAITTTKYQMLIDQCKATNDPGGCYELFHEMRVLLRDLDSVPNQCLSAVAAIPQVKTALLDVTKLLVQLGWGEKPPSTYFEKFGHWLDRADISLFCWLHRVISGAYGESSWRDLRDKTIAQLPGADTFSNGTSDSAKAREDLLDMTIFSENCAIYP